MGIYEYDGLIKTAYANNSGICASGGGVRFPLTPGFYKLEFFRAEKKDGDSVFKKYSIINAYEKN